MRIKNGSIVSIAKDKALREIAVVYKRISELKLDPKNPRQRSTRQIEQIAHSIQAFGFNVPVLIRSSGEVIAGHGRSRWADWVSHRKSLKLCCGCAPTTRLS